MQEVGGGFRVEAEDLGEVVDGVLPQPEVGVDAAPEEMECGVAQEGPAEPHGAREVLAGPCCVPGCPSRVRALAEQDGVRLGDALPERRDGAREVGHGGLRVAAQRVGARPLDEGLPVRGVLGERLREVLDRLRPLLPLHVDHAAGDVDVGEVGGDPLRGARVGEGLLPLTLLRPRARTIQVRLDAQAVLRDGRAEVVDRLLPTAEPGERAAAMEVGVAVPGGDLDRAVEEVDGEVVVALGGQGAPEVEVRVGVLRVADHRDARVRRRLVGPPEDEVEPPEARVGLREVGAQRDRLAVVRDGPLDVLLRDPVLPQLEVVAPLAPVALDGETVLALGPLRVPEEAGHGPQAAVGLGVVRVPLKRIGEVRARFLEAADVEPRLGPRGVVRRGGRQADRLAERLDRLPEHAPCGEDPPRRDEGVRLARGEPHDLAVVGEGGGEVAEVALVQARALEPGEGEVGREDDGAGQVGHALLGLAGGRVARAALVPRLGVVGVGEDRLGTGVDRLLAVEAPRAVEVPRRLAASRVPFLLRGLLGPPLDRDDRAVGPEHADRRDGDGAGREGDPVAADALPLAEPPPHRPRLDRLSLEEPADVLRELQRGGVAAVLLLLERLHHDRLHVAVDPVVDDRGARRLLVGDLVDDLVDGRSVERYAAGDRLVKDGAQGEDVASSVDLVRVPAGLLRGHVGRGPHDGAALREVRLGVGGLRQAEVGDLGDAVRVDQDVRRLDVAVDDAVLVGVVDRLADLPHEGEDLLDGDAGREGRPALRGGLLLPIDVVAEVASLQVLHREEVAAVLLSDLVDLHDVGVLEAGGGLGLAREAGDQLASIVLLGRGLVDPVVELEDLERHDAIEVALPGLVDDPHPPSGDLAEDLVLPELLRGGGDGELRAGGLGEDDVDLARQPDGRAEAAGVVLGRLRRAARLGGVLRLGHGLGTSSTRR